MLTKDGIEKSFQPVQIEAFPPTLAWRTPTKVPSIFFVGKLADRPTAQTDSLGDVVA
jgi:hypothetical protein